MKGKTRLKVRGNLQSEVGLLDVFPLTEENPVRIEFWGDEVDSIRSFDVESQRSTENLQEIEIYPATENWEDGNGKLFGIFSGKGDNLVFG